MIFKTILVTPDDGKSTRKREEPGISYLRSFPRLILKVDICSIFDEHFNHSENVNNTFANKSNIDIWRQFTRIIRWCSCTLCCVLG